MKRLTRPRAISPRDGDWTTVRESLKDLYTTVNDLVDRVEARDGVPPTVLSAAASAVTISLEPGSAWSWELAGVISTASTTDVYITADTRNLAGDFTWSHYIINGGVSPVESFSTSSGVRVARYDSGDDYVTAFGQFLVAASETRLIGVAHSDGVWQTFHGAAPGQARGVLRFLGGFQPGTRLLVRRLG